MTPTKSLIVETKKRAKILSNNFPRYISWRFKISTTRQNKVSFHFISSPSLSGKMTSARERKGSDAAEQDPDSRAVVIPPVHGNMCCTCVPLRSLHNQGRERKSGRVLVLLSAPAAPQGAAGVSTRAGSDALASARSDLQTLLWSDNGSDAEYLKNSCQIPAKQVWRKGQRQGTRSWSRAAAGSGWPTGSRSDPQRVLLPLFSDSIHPQGSLVCDSRYEIQAVTAEMCPTPTSGADGVKS